MNGLRKPFRKKSDPKNRKNSKNQIENAACEKANFCSNTIFSLYFKIGAKKIHAAKPLAFSLHFLFRRDQNHRSILTSKIMKMCEQILKKRTAPQYNSNSLNYKKNSPLRAKNKARQALQLQLPESKNKELIKMIAKSFFLKKKSWRRKK